VGPLLTRAVATLSRYLQRSRRLQSALLASGLVIVTFPDVFFKGTSLRMTDQLWGSYQAMPMHLAYWFNPLALNSRPPASWRSDWIVSYNDIGGAIWQSEPMMEFMRRTLAAADSPYWNPYSSAGSLGPETLVDLKFSVVTLAYSVLGGGSLVYNVVLLGCFWLATYFLVLLVREKLKLSVAASLAAGIFYLLNGYAAANIASNVALSYLFVPACLYAAFSFAEHHTRPRFAALSFAFAALLTFTFLPTTLASIAAIVTCTAGYAISKPEAGSRLRVLGKAIIGVVLALTAGLALCAIIYLPFGESLSVTGLLQQYSQRVFYPAHWAAALSMFTPIHFFESSWAYLDPQAAKLSGNVIYHFSALGLILAASALRLRGSTWRPLAWTCAAIVAVTLARIYGVPGFPELAAVVPVLRNIGEQYLWVAVVIPMTVLVALGADNLWRAVPARIPPTVVLLAGCGAGLILAANYGFQLSDPAKLTNLESIAALGLIGVAAVWIARRANTVTVRGVSGSGVLAATLVVLLFFELGGEARSLRFDANDSFASPTSEVPYLQTHLGNYRTMTLGAYATTMDRGGAYGIQEVTSLNAGTLPSFQAYFDRMTRALPPQYRIGNFVSLAYPQDAPNLDYYDWGLVDLLGVKYVVVPKTSVQYLAAFEAKGFVRVDDSQFTVVFENPDVLPRAFAVQIDPQGDDVTLPADLRQRAAPVTIATYRNTYVKLVGTTDRPKLVVLTDNWHQNWRALVNGTPVPIVRVDGTFRGVWVPEGPFTIDMSYAPKTLVPAIAISLATTALLIVLAITGRRRSTTVRLMRGRRPAPVDD
jgi:hypothetical protein